MVGFMKGLGCGCCGCEFSPDFNDDMNTRDPLWRAYSNAFPTTDYSPQIPFVWSGGSVTGTVSSESAGASNTFYGRGKSGAYMHQQVNAWYDEYPAVLFEQSIDVTLNRPLPGYFRTSAPYYVEALGYGHGGEIGFHSGADQYYGGRKTYATLNWNSGKLRYPQLGLPFFYLGNVERIQFAAVGIGYGLWTNYTSYPILYGSNAFGAINPATTRCVLETFNDIEYEAASYGPSTITKTIGHKIEMLSATQMRLSYFLDGSIALSQDVTGGAVAQYVAAWFNSQPDCNACVFFGVTGGLSDTDYFRRYPYNFDYGSDWGHWRQSFSLANTYGTGPMIYEAEFDNYSHTFNQP